MDITQAKQEVNEMFASLSPLITEIVDKYSKELDKIFIRLEKSKSLTNEEIREIMLALSIESYLFGISKDASVLKQECATSLMKEGQAQSYNNAQGTQVVRANQSLIDTTDKQVVNLLYSAVANMMKTKLDEAHRMVNALNSILISRNAEAKMTVGKSEEEQPTRQRLVENYDNYDAQKELNEIY